MEKLMGVVLLGVSLMVAGCGNQDNQGAQAPASSSVAAVDVQQVPTKQDVKSLQDQIKDVAVQAQNSKPVVEAQQNLQDMAGDLKAKAETLMAQAKEFVNQGKFEEAINIAQNVLSFDPQNIDAQQIIETAKAKIKEIADQKAGELKSGLMNTLNTAGQ